MTFVRLEAGGCDSILCGARLEAAEAPFPGSSMVEQSAVNRLVVGSSPAQGAKLHIYLP